MFNLLAAALMLTVTILIMVPLAVWLYARGSVDSGKPCCDKHAPPAPVPAPKREPEPENETDRFIREMDERLARPDDWRWVK